MSTSNTSTNSNQQNLADSGPNERPLMLEKGNYIPWESRFRRFLDNKLKDGERMWNSIQNGPYQIAMVVDPTNPTVPILELLSKMTEGNKKQYIADVRVMNYLLQAIPNDIYNSVDASKEGKSLDSVHERLTTLVNIMDRNNVRPIPVVSYQKLGFGFVNSWFHITIEVLYHSFVNRRFRKRFRIIVFDNRRFRKSNSTNSNQQNLADSGPNERPLMLEKGNYIPWESRFRRFLDNKLEDGERMWNSIQNGPYQIPMVVDSTNPTVPIIELLFKMTEGNKKQYIADVRVMSYLLQAIPNDIYNSVDTSKEGNSLDSVHERLTTLVNIMDRNNVRPIPVVINTKFLNCFQPEWSKYVTMVRHNQTGPAVSYDVLYDQLVQFEPHVLASRAKKAAKNHDPLALIAHSNVSSSHSHANSSYSTQPYYVTHPPSVVNYDDEYQGELQGDSQEDKLTTAMMNQAVVQDGRVDIQTKNAGYGGNANKNAGRNKTQGFNAGNAGDESNQIIQRVPRTESIPGKANVQCYNCNEKGHYARECQKPKVRDAKYFREQMLLAMKDEAGSNLSNEENDFMLDTSYGEDLEELTIAVMLMARLQPADDNAEIVPSYDAKAVSQVHASSKIHEQVSHGKRQTIIQTTDDDQIDSNIIFDDPFVENNGGTSEHDSIAHDKYREIQMIAYNVQREAKNQKHLNNELKKQKDLLQRELETFKDRVKTFESKTIQYSTYKETCDELERELRNDKDTIDRLVKEKEQIQNDFLKVENEKIIIQHETKLEKKAFKERENRYLDDILDLEEKLSYTNPERLKKAIAAQPKMYNGDLIHSNKLGIHTTDSEETLEDAEESRNKMRHKIVQIDYEKLNALYETFVPQQEFSAEQTYFSIPSTSDNGSTSKDVPSESPEQQKHELLKVELEKSASDSRDIQVNLLKRIKILKNDFQRSQAQSIDFELKLQHQKDKIDYDVSWKAKLSTLHDQNVLLKHQVESIVKERENIKLEFQKLFNSIKATRAQHQNEINEMIEDVTQKTYAYADVRAQNQDLLMTISELKNKLKTIDKGKHVNTKFDKSKTLGQLLCVTPFNTNLAIKAKNVSNTKVTSDRSNAPRLHKKTRLTNSQYGVSMLSTYVVSMKITIRRYSKSSKLGMISKIYYERSAHSKEANPIRRIDLAGYGVSSLFQTL
ncbi:retrovirus-related pol polyprotein from transposon TNT 1-94 [Tanacetum coccineum]